MMAKVALMLCLLWCLLSALSFVGHSNVWAFKPEYRASFNKQLAFIESKHPKYTRGGASDLKKGLDCSGYLFLAAKWAGVPGITRTTSAKMAQGLGGWSSQKIEKDWARAGDLWFGSFKLKDDHTGAFAGGEYIYHASWGAQQIVKALYKYMDKSFSQARELTIGD